MSSYEADRLRKDGMLSIAYQALRFPNLGFTLIPLY
jgi:hypothetical protein